MMNFGWCNICVQRNHGIESFIEAGLNNSVIIKVPHQGTGV